MNKKIVLFLYSIQITSKEQIVNQVYDQQQSQKIEESSIPVARIYGILKVCHSDMCGIFNCQLSTFHIFLKTANISNDVSNWNSKLRNTRKLCNCNYDNKTATILRQDTIVPQ